MVKFIHRQVKYTVQTQLIHQLFSEIIFAPVYIQFYTKHDLY